jgi:hypothetical protein
VKIFLIFTSPKKKAVSCLKFHIITINKRIINFLLMDNDNESNSKDELIQIRKLRSIKCQVLKTGYKPVNITYYFCNCDPDQKEPICEECFKSCHRGHTLVTTYALEAVCSCGQNGHMKVKERVDEQGIRDCLFMQWSKTNKSCVVYTDSNGNKFCLFCANFCNSIEGLKRVVHNPTDDLGQCSCKNDLHRDTKNIYARVNAMENLKSLKFENINPVQAINMMTLSQHSFENVYTKMLQFLVRTRQTLEFPDFHFESNIAYSSFMLGLLNFKTLALQCKTLCHFTDYFKKTLESKFVYAFMEKKFDHRSENIWNLKLAVFTMFYTFIVKKDFVLLPNFTVRDMENMNPLHRVLMNTVARSKLKSQGSTVFSNDILEMNFTLIEKIKNIKEKTPMTFEILNICYKIIKLFTKHNLLTSEQITKFCLINDDVIYKCTDLNEKHYDDNILKTQIKMLIPMIKSLKYLVYYHNDGELYNSYLIEKQPMEKIQFFHASCEEGKVINKNTINILNFIRTMKDLDENSLSLMKKILIYSNNITAISIEYPDAYLSGFRRLIDINAELYINYINDIFTKDERSLLNYLNKEACTLEELYQGYFEFRADIGDIEKAVIVSIRGLFEMLNIGDFKAIKIPDTLQDVDKSSHENKEVESLVGGNKDQSSVKMFRKSKSLLDNSANAGISETKKLEAKCKILLNKSTYINAIYNSLQIIFMAREYQTDSVNRSDNILDSGFLDEIFRLLYFYTEESMNNATVMLTDYFLRLVDHIDVTQILMFSEYIYQILHMLDKFNIELANSKQILHAIKVILCKISKDPSSSQVLKKMLSIISVVSELSFCRQEYTSTKLRKLLKQFFSLNPIITDYIKLLIDNASKKVNSTNLSDSQEDLNGYSLKELDGIVIKFISLTNDLFDGNATLNEQAFLRQIIHETEVPTILSNTNLNLKLRIEILKFFRMIYIDVIIDKEKIDMYRSYFVNPIALPEDNGLFENGYVYKFYNDVISINSEIQGLSLESSIIKFELKNFKRIMLGSKCFDDTLSLQYFEDGIILPLYVFLNKFMSIIYNLKGYEYLKLYEIVYYFLRLKKYLISRKDTTHVRKSFAFKAIFKNFLNLKKNKYSLINKEFKDTDLAIVDKDLETLTQSNFQILNYKLLYSYYEKHIDGFLQKSKSKSLIKYFQKKNEFYTEEKIMKLEFDLKHAAILKTPYQKQVFDLIIKYENEKNKFSDSAFVQNLGEQNIIYDSNYRNLVLRSVFYLVCDKKFQGKYRTQNFWNLFKLLQYDTVPTQEEVLQLYNETPLFAENFKDIFNLFLENLLSIIFSSCNPSTSIISEDYYICITIIKIMKYLCEEHNNDFQRIFFQELKFNYFPLNDKKQLDFDNTKKVSLFELMLGILCKIIVIAKWEKVKFGYDEGAISYFYDIFFVIIELLIEMVQGTDAVNLESLVKTNKEDDEQIGFHYFLNYVKVILLRDKQDSSVLYRVRKNIIDFIVAFLEEKSTPKKLINTISSVYSPFTIIETIVNTLTKLYIKTHPSFKKKGNTVEVAAIKSYKKILFDDRVCDYFVNLYFSDESFCQSEEFDFANRMFQYVKLLAEEYKYEDAITIINLPKEYDDHKIISSFTKLNNKEALDNDFIFDENFYQNYFIVKFFETITRTVLVQNGDDIVRVLYTINPLIPNLSENTKKDFFENVNRESRYSKLFSLVEECDYFYEEISYNSTRRNIVYRIGKGINYHTAEKYIYLVTLVLNLIMFFTLNYDEYEHNSDEFVVKYNILKGIGIFHIIINAVLVIFWYLTKFPLYYLIEKKRYSSKNKIQESELSWSRKLTIAYFDAMLYKNEIFGFQWNIIWTALGISEPKNLFFLSIEMLIVVNLSVILKNIVKSVTIRAKQLAASSLLIIIIIYVFSSLAFYFLNSDYVAVYENVRYKNYPFRIKRTCVVVSSRAS